MCLKLLETCTTHNTATLGFYVLILGLRNIPENISIFFKEKTYVKKDDPKLFEKIGNHLWLMREHDIKDDNMEQEYLFGNQDEG